LDGDPPLVFTLGTTAVNEPGAFFAESLAAARDLGLRSVLLAGPRARATLPEAASDAIAVEYAPHDLLFPHALAVVHQGGIGTLAEAMQAGKPMLIMPYAHDQTDNAWRAARLGVARVISRRHYQSDALRLEMSRVLKDPTAFDAAAAAAIAIARESGAKIAAELILDALT
jgi:UDP:flavonoid glycosyltransferase YjiC (YdhE family)